MGRFENRVVVVTGGALGIGRCLCGAFAAEGASVAFLDWDAEAGEAFLPVLQQTSPDAFFMAGDAADPRVLEAFAGAVRDRYGRVDVLVNNACFSNRGLLSGCSWEDFNEILKVGVAAPYYLTSLFLPVFGEGASVLNISSTRALQSQADTESYSAAKGGITALTHAMAASLRGRVRVNAIAPGWIDTATCHPGSPEPVYQEADCRQHPSGRVGEPGDIARAALFLCDPANSFIDGEMLVVDGGMTRQMIYHADEGWSLGHGE